MIKLRKKQKGFTLVELLIVIAIIAVLAAVVTPVALGAIKDSKSTAVYAEIKAIETADLTYFVQNSATAGTIEALDLNGMVEDETKNATYSLSGVAGTSRLLTVTLKDGITATDVVKKAGDIKPDATSGEYKLSDGFSVKFTTATAD